jgi:uncharacterized membrane protein YtjA (UPF0391 family)
LVILEPTCFATLHGANTHHPDESPRPAQKYYGTAFANPAKAFKGSTSQNRSLTMISWALTFLVIAIIAAILGFSGVAGTAAWAAQVCVVVFLVLFVISLIAGRRTPVA